MSQPRVIEAIDVLVIGEALIDVVRSPAGDVGHVGGSPANVALGLGRLGVDVALLTCIGRDARGTAIAEHLADSGVDVLEESFSDAATSTAIATLAADGSASYQFDVTWRLPAGVLPVRPRIVHTGSIAAFLAPGADAVREHLAGVGADEITFDPNIRPALIGSREQALPVFEQTARLASVVKLSDEDAEWLYPGDGPAEVLERILALGPRLAAITLGGAGSMLAAGDHTVEVPVTAVDVVDTIGAGDTYMASMIDSILAEGTDALTRDAVERIGRRASRAAAVTVSRAGADLPTRAEIG